MSGIIHYETFVLSSILLNITPGSDTLFILSRSVAQGKKAGVASVLGIGTGCLLHTAFAAFGLSLVIARSIVLFNIVKYAGAAYLVWMGVKLVSQKTFLQTGDSAPASAPSLSAIYRDAVLTNFLNPKVALFFIAFLPQFVEPAYRQSAVPFLLLGATFCFTGTLWCLGLANFASVISAGLRSNNRLATYLNKSCGVVFILLGMKTALASRG